MGRIFLSVFLFTFLLTACEPLPADTTPPAAESPPPTFRVQQADVPPGDYAPWQMAYAAFLTDLRQKEGELKNWYDGDREEDMVRWSAYLDSSEDYSLYDVDKDGIPELFIRYNSCEADYHTTCYTFRDGTVVDIGMFYSGHSNLDTWPDGNGVILNKGHQGLSHMEKYSIVERNLVSQGVFFEEEIWGTGKDYTPVTDLVPGAEHIPSYLTPTHWRPANSPALLLPIYDYNALPRQAEPYLEEAAVRSAIGKVLWESEPLYGVSGDGFDGDTGFVSLAEYLQPGMASPFTDTPLTIAEYTWTDVNGDGQTDCILRLDSFYAILSLQDKTVYAYLFNYIDGFGVDPDGSVYLRSGRFWSQTRFYKNQCYEIHFATPVEGCDLSWDPFPPTP